MIAAKTLQDGRRDAHAASEAVGLGRGASDRRSSAVISPLVAEMIVGQCRAGIAPLLIQS